MRLQNRLDIYPSEAGGSSAPRSCGSSSLQRMRWRMSGLGCDALPMCILVMLINHQQLLLVSLPPCLLHVVEARHEKR